MMGYDMEASGNMYPLHHKAYIRTVDTNICVCMYISSRMNKSDTCISVSCAL